MTRHTLTKRLIVAAIDTDHLWKPGHSKGKPTNTRWELSPNEVKELFPNAVLVGLTKTRWRCLDDDALPYYGGWLYNDQDCEIQQSVLNWCMADAGCTSIQVKDNNKWVYEIG